MSVANRNDFANYTVELDEAYRCVQQAINDLKSKGVKTIVLFGHNMGLRMMSVFATSKLKLVNRLIIAGCRNTETYPLDCSYYVAHIKIKTLDIYGDGKDIDSAGDRRDLVSSEYTQTAIKNANHKFDEHN